MCIFLLQLCEAVPFATCVQEYYRRAFARLSFFLFLLIQPPEDTDTGGIRLEVITHCVLRYTANMSQTRAETSPGEQETHN